MVADFVGKTAEEGFLAGRKAAFDELYDARAQAGEAASFWRSTFERVETDAEKRAALVVSSQAALDSDLTGKDAAGQKTILATALSVCTRLRPFAERVEKTAEVKP